MKKIIPIIILILLLTGCSSEKKDSYTLNEIYKSKAFGFFVKDGNTFYPVKFINNDGTENFQWCVGELNCPKVTKDTPLVAVFELNEDMPDEYFIEKYESLGYSFGANVSIGEDENSLWLETGDMCSGSDIDKSFGELNVDSLAEIDSINEEKPFSNVDTDINVLIGLQKDKYYDLNLYVGTQSLKGTICADTMILKQTGHTDLDKPLKKTDKQYFVVNLPENINPGYYDINNEGFFKI